MEKNQTYLVDANFFKVEAISPINFKKLGKPKDHNASIFFLKNIFPFQTITAALFMIFIILSFNAQLLAPSFLPLELLPSTKINNGFTKTSLES